MDVFCQSNNRRQFWSKNDDGDDSSSAGGSAGRAKTFNTKQEFDFAELEPTSRKYVLQHLLPHTLNDLELVVI
jgi:hypothetical protein